MKIAVMAAALFFLAGSAPAGFIRITTGLEIKDERLEVTVGNEGDEAARNVQLRLDFLGRELSGEDRTELTPGQAYTEDFEFDRDRASLPGAYPAVITVSYTDLNGYPFSALSARLLPIGEAIRGDLHLTLSPLRLGRRAVLPVDVTNRSARPKQVELELKVSSDITVREAARSFAIEPWGKEEFRFTLENFSALEGSTYPVFALAVYQEEGRQYAGLAFALVSIKSPSMWSNPYFWLAAIVLALVFALTAWLFLKRKAKARAPASDN